MTSFTDRYSEAAKDWVEADSSASLMEELKLSSLNQMIIHLNVDGEMTFARREAIVRSSDKWQDYIKEMVQKRTKANLLKIRLEVIRMQYNETRSNHD